MQLSDQSAQVLALLRQWPGGLSKHQLLIYTGFKQRDLDKTLVDLKRNRKAVWYRDTKGDQVWALR